MVSQEAYWEKEIGLKLMVCGRKSSIRVGGSNPNQVIAVSLVARPFGYILLFLAKRPL